jgi:hypothetical protein
MKLTRRHTLVVAALVVALGASGVGAYFWWRQEQRNALIREIMPEVNKAFSEQINKALDVPPYGGFELKRLATCTDGMTTLTLVFRANGPGLLRNLNFSGITLGGVKPENPVPVTIAELQPGTEVKVTLRFLQVPWNRLGDINTKYQTGLNIREEYEGPPDSGQRWNSSYTGIPVDLNAESVRELESKRGNK